WIDALGITPGVATKLAITSINNGISPSVNTPFNVVVQAQDALGNPANVTQNTDVQLYLHTGTGTLGGNLTGTIQAGTNTITISGVTYNTIETGVQIRVERTSGDILEPGISEPFNVLDQASQLAFVNVPARAQLNIKMAPFTVEARRPDNSVDPNYTGTVTITKLTGPGNVYGALEKTCVGGIATFDSVCFDEPGDYTLSATAPNLTGATSSTITVLPVVIPLVEDFDYTAGTSLTYNGWSPHSAAGSNSVMVTSPGLTYTGYLSSDIGNAAKVDTTGEDVNRTFTQQTSGSIYVAFLVNVTKATNNGDYFFHLGPYTIGNTYVGRIYVKKDASDNLAFGLSKGTEAATYTDHVYSLNTTYLMVLKYEIVSGAQNDRVSLFIFSSGVPSSEPLTPTIGPISPSSSDPVNIGSVALRQGTAQNAPRVIVDGIRIGTSWGVVSGVEPPIITNVARSPKNPLKNQPVMVTAKIYDDSTTLAGIIDTLFYAINTTTNWNWVLKDNFNPLDSTFTYTIPAHSAEGDTIFYRIRAADSGGGTTYTSIYSYVIPFELTIQDIQGSGASSPHEGKYVHTKGIVTGTIGARFFIEEMPGGAWHGLYIYRRAQDSLPKLMVGDSVGVWGIVKEYYTLTEIDAGYNLDGAVEKYASGRAVPCTTKLRFDAITEEYEGTLIRVDSVYFKESGNFSGGTNYWLYSLTSDDSVRLRIDAATPIVGISIPQETLAIICNLSAYKDTYQLMPRTPSDFLPYYFDLAVTEILQPRGTVPSDVKIRPKAKVKNLGSLPSPACRAVFNITESKQFEYTDTVDLTALQPGQEVIVSFRDYRVLGNPGTIYQTEAKILVSDRNSVNNVLIGDGFEVGNWLSPRWYMQPDVPQPPDLKEGKYVKDGGALVAAGNVLYAFPGNKSRRFYKFTPSDGWGTWAECESIPFGPKPGKPTQLNNKKVGKGAALCYDGSRYIYATKGNGTFEFWKYDIQLDTWFYLDSVPTIKGLKGGTSLAYQGGYVYLLAGGLKLSDDYFFRYSVSGDSWEVLPKPNLPAHVTKPWKDGSAIVAYGGYIYAMKGGESKVNYFAKFNCASRSWAPGYDSLPTYNLVWTGNEWREKKSFVKDGGALTLGDGYMYAIKGGGAVCLFAYDPAVPYSWYQLDTIPKRGGEKKSVPKTGAALAYLESNHYLYLMIGNNRPDFWRYGPLGYGIAKHSPVPIVSSTVMSTEKQAPVGTVRITSNLLSKSAVVSYSIIRPSYISLKLYDALGRVVANMYEGQAWAGTYTMTIDTKSLSSGVYFLKLTSDYGNAEAKLLIE
ncbi:MAG: T9SS type A sorting domain-containing protein, partial [candidate division WOR-3 bacterium]